MRVLSSPVAVPPETGTAVAERGTARTERGGRRPEIQGLRAVAVVLVAVYHVWFGRVSGGVDVFLLLTGFLITGSLLRAVERDGRVGFAAFWTRLTGRLFPAAAVVLAGVLAATALLLPQDRWRDTIAEVVASALYYENWYLAFNAVDYLSRGDAVSPAQHFWSLAIQGQFYLVWPVLVAVALLVARRRGAGVRRVLLVLVAAVFVVSFAYSVVITETNQRWAYFDTGARLWELALGGVLAIVLPRLRIPGRLRVVMGWVGLVGLVACGMLLQVSTMFPGYVALWPTGAAALVIMAGTTGSRFGADRLLALRPLHYIGDISYALYLWHWPVLVCYLTVTGRTQASLTGGFQVLALSFALAAATKWLVEGGMGKVIGPRATPARTLAVALACLLPVTLAAGAWSAHLAVQRHQAETLAADPANYPGAAVLADGVLDERLPDVPVHPAPVDAADDLPASYALGCNQGIAGSEALTCEFGEQEAERTIALVGGSHAAHWLPALQVVAEEKGWRVVNITKGACLFTPAPQRYKGEDYTSCTRWNDNVMAELAELRPDVVFTTATTSSIDPASGYDGESVVDGYLERWAELGELGIDVVAVRDTPRLDFAAPECVAERGADTCVGTAEPSLAPVSPLQDLEGVSGNVSFVDLTDHLCVEGRCPAVIGNVLVYWDNAHFTATFARTLAPALGAEIERATGW
ncbi:acyltransferase family protein [Marinactinospora thermotolerans]|uniref:acyltransferase family protein n=1 Tax=Marinactinospora thermotolerans TaxID=531310 RepID=UPI003D92B6AD